MTKSSEYVPDRGDIVWINLDPRVGHEQAGHRLALVISRQRFNQVTRSAFICPITSQIKGRHREIRIKERKTNGVLLPFHFKSVDFAARQVAFYERANPEMVKEVVRTVEAVLV